MADISLSNLDYSARSSYGNHDLDHEAPTPSACIDVDRELTRTLLPVPSRLPPDDDGEVSSEVEYLQNSSMSTFANETIRLRHRREAPEALAEHRESDQDVSSLTGQFATRGKGWWKQQMLVDRSLRSMAALTGTFALIMVIICLAYLPDLRHRMNDHSTSVGGSRQSCESVERTDVAIHLLINIAATMTLGMSNTYQQLVTSLRASEIPWILSTHEDSRVGTNSPMTIRHKKNGKVGSLLAWLLLIATSLPLHLLANSIIGPSYYITPTQDIRYNLVDKTVSLPVMSDIKRVGYGSCWIAFLSGSYFLHKDESGALTQDAITSAQFKTLNITYSNPRCAVYQNSSTAQDLIYNHHPTQPADWNCSIIDIWCTGVGLEVPKCRLNIRMSAAFTLTACLLIKATYMISIAISARHRTKTHCLTFGDVIVASAVESDLQVHNECMVNAGDGHRHRVKHTCHKKHCSKNSEPSMTGDDIGHCQKCKKFNTVDKAADLLHPCLSTKFKKSLLSNLGSTAVSQMIILVVCTLTMLGISIKLVIAMSSEWVDFQSRCLIKYSLEECEAGVFRHLKNSFGTFGGFKGSAHLSSLPPDSLSSEMLTFMISNGAQLLYSLLYLLLVYNITLISMERDWGNFEKQRRRPRCTLVKGDGFDQSYLLQLPKKVIFPMMAFSAIMHWLLGQAISTTEIIWVDPEHLFDPSYPRDSGKAREHSMYTVGYGTYSVWLSTILMMAMTATCWWAFTSKREGFMPQMYGSIRTCCSSTTELRDFPRGGIQWGDLGTGEKFRHAGFSDSGVDKIVAGELYCGRGSSRFPQPMSIRSCVIHNSTENATGLAPQKCFVRSIEEQAFRHS